MNNKRTVFFVSDRTGLTVEVIGRSLISQFENIEFRRVTLPYVDSVDKAKEASVHIDAAAQEDRRRPLVFSTLTQPELRNMPLAAPIGRERNIRRAWTQ